MKITRIAGAKLTGERTAGRTPQWDIKMTALVGTFGTQLPTSVYKIYRQ